MVLDTSLLNTWHSIRHVSMIKWSNPGKSVVVVIEKGAIGLPLITLLSFIYIYIYI